MEKAILDDYIKLFSEKFDQCTQLINALDGLDILKNKNKNNSVFPDSIAPDSIKAWLSLKRSRYDQVDELWCDIQVLCYTLTNDDEKRKWENSITAFIEDVNKHNEFFNTISEVYNINVSNTNDFINTILDNSYGVEDYATMLREHKYTLLNAFIPLFIIYKHENNKHLVTNYNQNYVNAEIEEENSEIEEIKLEKMQPIIMEKKENSIGMDFRDNAIRIHGGEDDYKNILREIVETMKLFNLISFNSTH